MKRDTLAILAENIKMARLRCGYTQSELAALVGYTDRSSVAKIEQGRVDISCSKLLAIAQLVNIPPTNLLGIEICENADIAVHPYVLARYLAALDETERRKVVEYAEKLAANG